MSFMVKQYILISIILISSLAHAEEVINLSCADKEDSSVAISVIIDLTNKKFITENQTFDLLVTESTYAGKDDSYLTNVIRYRLNRVTLELAYQELNLSMGGNIDRMYGLAEDFKKSYSCSVVSKI